MTVWPILYFVFFLGFIAYTFMNASASERNVAAADAFKKKVLWVLVLFFGSIFAFPIYWYLYIWSVPTPRGGRDVRRPQDQ